VAPRAPLVRLRTEHDRQLRRHPRAARARARRLPRSDGFCTPVGTEYLRDFLDRHWGQSAPATRRQRLAATRSFFQWAMGEGLCGWNPAARDQAAERDRGGTEERIAYAMPTLLHLVRSQPSMRDQCALQLLCRMALRKNELRLLQVRDVDLVRDLIVVHGKGGGTTVMPLEFRSLRDDLYLHIQGEQRHGDEFLIYPRNHRTRADGPGERPPLVQTLPRARRPADTIKTHEMRHSRPTICGAARATS
jgi:site-specific recombinase XerC